MTDYLSSRTKDPNDKLDTGFDWDAHDFLANRSTTIASSTWVVASGLTSASTSNTTTKTLIRILGGTANTDYVVTNRVVLASGEQYERSVRIRVRDR